MPLMIRVTSADGKMVYTRGLEGNPAPVKLPRDAKIAVVDQATGEVVPLLPKVLVDAEGEERIVFAGEHEGEEIAVIVEGEAALWPADTELALSEGLDGVAPAEIAAGDVSDIREGARFEEGEGGFDGEGGISPLALVLFGAIGIGVVAVVASGDDDDDDEDTAAPTPPAPPPDTAAPAAPTGIDLAAASDSGLRDDDDITNLTSGLVITGNAEPGSTVRLFAGGTQVGGTQTAAAGTGAFSFTFNLPAGTNNITVTATDAAGNVSAASAPVSIIVDTTAPLAPTAIDLVAEDDTGASNTDNLTNLTSGITMTGNAEAGSRVEAFSGTTSLGVTTATAAGTFSIDLTVPGEGVYAVTFRATDPAGNASPPSAPFTLTVDTTAPAAPTGLRLAAEDDDGFANDDGITDRIQNLTITGAAAAGSTVTLFANGTSLGTTTADAQGRFTFDFNAPATGNLAITATATDTAGNASAASAPLALVVGAAPAAINTSIDGTGNIVTVYFDEMLAAASAPAPGQFTITDASGATLATVTGTEIVGNRVRLFLSSAIDEAAGPRLAYTSAPGAVTDMAGNAAPNLAAVPLNNELDLTGNGAIGIGRIGNTMLAGAEIVAFDPASDRFFVTSGSGLQVIGVDANLNFTLLGTVTLGSNAINSVAVRNGLVAVAVGAAVKTDPGTVFLLDADAAVGPGMILSSVTVGALPDMVAFTPDGTRVLVANEGEQSDAGVTPVVDPEGSVSIINVANPAAPTVQTADFTAFNTQLEALRAEGVRLFAGLPGFETVTVAQDLEPEYISVSPDGTRALITLQENNAIAVLDIASATIIDVRPLGLKPFLGLPSDFSDRDSGIQLDTNNPVFGQFMPDAIASFTGADGNTYYVIANEGDDRDDFISPNETARLSGVTLDPTAFPDAAAVQANTELGRLNISNFPGLRGDTDGDGDIDRILTYGARSFSILDARGSIVFDSGSHIEQFVALGGLYDEDSNTGLFDDSRSDNKGPEPEGITTGVFGNSVLAFVALERGGGGVMVYDVTDPANVQFVTYFRDMRDVSPEGLVYISAADSPSGQPVLAVANEVSNTLTAYEIAPAGTFRLQLLHFADAEAGLLASQTAPRLAALVDAFEDEYFNSITLVGGDNFIPGPFLAGGADPSITAVLPGGSTQGRVDIAIHNAIGVEASAIGNHEFDLGSQGFADAFRPSGAWVGAQFPYLSANLDFSGDSVLAGAFTETLGVGGLETATSLNGRIAPSAVLIENGERIGLVGVTTQLLELISNPTGTEVKGFPVGPGANGEMDDMQLLALQLQPYIDDLIAQGVNKIILLSHLQLLGNEQALAPLLQGVDIIVAAGSNTRLADETDELVAFPGHAATAQGPYPIVTQGVDGAPSLIVNTDSEFTYLGRLVVDFDAAGRIVLSSLNPAINGAYAASDENVAEAYGIPATDNVRILTNNGTLSALAATEALAGNAYANFHTTQFPAGEVRGQLMLVQDNRNAMGNGTIVFETMLSGANEVPPVGTEASGSGRVIVLASDGTFTYNSEYVINGLAQADLIGGHIHIGMPGMNGPIEENILADTGTQVIAFAFDLTDTAFAPGTRGGRVQELTNAVQDVIDVKSANVFGFSDVYLEGARAAVRSQETNLGNLTADANADAARDALGLSPLTPVVSLKNGGGIRSQIGTVSGTGADVVFGPNPGGAVSQLDIENSLRFDNALMVFDTTPQGLLNILNNPAATTPNNGGFFQIGGLQVSYDPSAPAGSRIRDISLVDENGFKVAAIANDGVIVPGAPATITMVTLNFTANGGDGYPIKANGSNFRFLLEDGTVSAPVDPSANFTSGAVVPANVLNEQEAFAQYLAENFATPEMAFDEAETPPAEDERIQNQAVRTDTVLDGIPAFTLQLLHLADGEAGLLASQTAPFLAALADAFEDDFVNSITLAGGDNYIPGPFFAAGADPSISAVLLGGSTQGRVDIAIHNAIGVQASAIGNHEFDIGSQGFRDAFAPSGAWVGAQFPYISANLDFSGDSVLAGSFTETLNVGGLEEASSLNGRIAPSAVITENGERIGVVGVTTQLLEQLSSPTGTEVKGFPIGPGANGEMDDMALLASQLQPYINDLLSQGVNKIILVSHLQFLGNEQALAPLLTGVDIILAAGSNTRLGDANDEAVAFPGHAATFAGPYPIVTQGTDGAPTLIVNTDNEYTYLGRLIVDFDAAGRILPTSVDKYIAIAGAYAATAENAAEAWNTTVAGLETTAFATGTRGARVRELTEAVQDVIDVKSSNIFGYSDVYLEGARAAVRSEETNLGNLTADANADAAKDALGLGPADFLVSLKNGGGIRAQIGTVTGTGAEVTFGPNPDGVVSQLDVENSLRFDNALMVFDTTPQGLLNILNNPAATTFNNGGFLQIGGMQISFDPSAPAGSRIRDVALVNEAGGKVAVIDDGVVVAGAPASITMVALNFTANGGDGYPIKANGSNFRFLLEGGGVSDPLDPSANFTSGAVVPANVLNEQEAFAEYLMENFGTPELAFDEAETPPAEDERIQNQAVRTDTVLDPPMTGMVTTIELMAAPGLETFA